MTFLIIHGIGGHAGIHWQRWLKDQLEARGYNVLMPEMPQSDHPDRLVWLNKVKEVIGGIPNDELIIVGHSLGVASALDFIENIETPIRGLVSVSGFSSDYGAELNSYFMSVKHIDFEKVRKNVSTSVVFYGNNDPYVTQEALKEVADELNVAPHIIKDGGHLNSDAGFTEFPQLLVAIDEQLLSNE